ncbi:hypothetical protein GBA52_021113 [Prunus armeniaca]|nr:hypothetical protein GBA52_021113 [Prunus armeniaca]
MWNVIFHDPYAHRPWSVLGRGREGEAGDGFCPEHSGTSTASQRGEQVPPQVWGFAVLAQQN